MEDRRLAVHRTIVVVDVEGFGDRRRTNPQQVAVRNGLYRAMRDAFCHAGIPWDGCGHEDRGDGVFILIPAEVPKGLLVESLPSALVTALHAHNGKHPGQERIRLRMALHAGEVNYDEHGTTAASINLAFRLLDASALKAALVGSSGVLAVIASSWFFEEVVRHSAPGAAAAYRPVPVDVKETTTIGWICLPDHIYPSGQAAESPLTVTVVAGRQSAVAPPVLPTTESPPPPEATASGTHTAAASQFKVPVATGDRAQLNARTAVLAAGGIPRPGDVGVAPGMSNLPRPPAAVFVGRDAALRRLEQALAGRASAVVHGLAGVGKSELALHYAHACHDRYELVWWITADDASQIEVGLASLAARICPEIAVAATTCDAAGWAICWLQTHTSWLLALDNANNAEHIQPLLGQLHGGHIVLTTRRDLGWHRLATPIPLDVLAPVAAVELITTATGRTGPADQATGAAIAAELGYLPLALDQAAAYISQTRITLNSYLTRLRQHPARMHAASAEGGDAQRTVSRLWDMTLAAIDQRKPAAVWLLRVLAQYAPDNIPRSILGGQHSADSGTDDPADVDDSLGLLASYSMITLTPGAVSVHRLVQSVILATTVVTGGGAPPARDTALDWLNQAMPPVPGTQAAAWPLLRALVPHADKLASHYTAGEEPENLGRVLNEVAFFHQAQGDYERARTLRVSALEIIERNFGTGHLHTATCLGNLAATYGALGRHTSALPLAERALAITETALGPDHPDTGICLGNLAATYGALGRHTDALPLAERALAITETALGPDDPMTARCLGHLARTYSDLGRHTETLPLEQRALAMSETALGPDDPMTAIWLGNLARTYGTLGRHTDALPLAERALAITETALGPDDPTTARCLGHLAHTYRALGRHADALPLEQRALAITESALGPDQSGTSVRLGHLARAYGSPGRQADALPLAERALAITESALGPDHPDTAVRLGNLAATYDNLGRHTDALHLAERGHRCAFTALGAGHITTEWLARLSARLRDRLNAS